MATLIETLSGSITPETIDDLAGLTGEPAAAVRRATNVALPVLAAALVNKGATVTGAEQLLGPLREVSVETGSVNDLLRDRTDMLRTSGAALLPVLFGMRSGDVANRIASSAGTSTQAATSLLTLLAPVALAWLGRQLPAGRLDAPTVSDYLSMQRDSVSGALPVGFDTLLTGPEAARFTPAPAAAAVPVEEPSSPMRWLIPLLGLIALAALLWFLLRPAPGITDETGGLATPGAVATDAAGAVGGTPDAMSTDAVGGAAADITAFCTAIADLDTAMTIEPAWTADTPVSDVQGRLDQISTSFTAVTGAGAALTDVDLAPLTDAWSRLTTGVQNISGDVVGENLAPLTTALDDVRTAYDTARTQAACP
jgi:hypothetical protein